MRWCLIFISLCSPASAGFMDTKSLWDGLNAFQKETYVMGYMDGFLTYSLTDTKLNSYKKDLTDCIIELGLKTTQMTEIVAKGYEDLSGWDKSPSTILLAGLRTVCMAKINASRTSRGEEPIVP